MNILSLFTTWKFKLVAIVVVFLGLFLWHQHRLDQAVQQAVTKTQLVYAQENLRLLEKANASSRKLETEVEAIRKESNAKIKARDDRIALLTASLHNRPERPASQGSIPGDSGNAESPGFVDASRLYREDAAVAIWFASRTEGLKIKLQQCYDQYDTVKSTLEKFQQDNKPKID